LKQQLLSANSISLQSLTTCFQKTRKSLIYLRIFPAVKFALSWTARWKVIKRGQAKKWTGICIQIQTTIQDKIDGASVERKILWHVSDDCRLISL